MEIFREPHLFFQKPCTFADFFQKEKPTVGIHGIHGSFTEQALFRLTQEELFISEDQYSLRELVHSENLLHAVAEGEVDLGIFAFANSGSGGYLSSVIAMGKYSYNLVALMTMPICMCLIVHPDIQKASEIKEFRGHPVAMTMCRNTLKREYSLIPAHADTDEMDTALSVDLLMKGELPKTTAVFASERAAQIYGAKVFHKGVHDDPNNATFFALVRKVEK